MEENRLQDKCKKINLVTDKIRRGSTHKCGGFWGFHKKLRPMV